MSYQIENWKHIGRLRHGIRAVSSTVVYLGLTSFFTDISSAMVSTVLPLYLVLALGLSPLQFGVVDGLYQGVSAVIRVAAGFAADRWRHYKEVAITGYGLSALTRIGLLAMGSSALGLSASVIVARIGKGIRTAPRDALISLSSPQEDLGTAFAVHRALDTGGAMIGHSWRSPSSRLCPAPLTLCS